MCLGHALFNFTFKRHPLEDKMKKDSYLAKKLMGDRFGELHTFVRENRAKLKAIQHEELHIETADGLKLVGWFFDAGSKNTFVIVHGYNSRGWTDGVALAYRAYNRGYNVLISDNRACGESEGEYLTFGVRESEDIARWVELVAKRIPDGDIVLQGTSLGGATVCMCSAMELPNVKAIISDCAFTSMRAEFEHMSKMFLHFVAKTMLNAEERVTKKKFGFDFTSQSPIESIKQARYPVFFVHGRADTFIPYASAEELYSACPTEKQLLLVDNCGHGGSQLAGDEYYEPIFEFVEKHLQ